MTKRILDRKVRHDPRSLSYPIGEVIGDKPFIDNVWECNAWNDQGVEGACVGFGWSHELAATPEPVPASADLARKIYRRAQQLDVWPGEEYEGTSVLGGAKAVMEIKNNVGEPYISEYRWAFGVADVMKALAYQGPVVLGLNWYSGMFDTDSAGWLRVSGQHSGGHCLLAIGVVIIPVEGHVGQVTTLAQIDLDNSYVVLHNSWGRDWGVLGRAKMSIRDLQRLLSERGDACVPMVRVSDRVIEPVAPSADEPAPAPVPQKTYFAVRRSNVFHDWHPGLRVYRRFDTRETALQSGFRPCNVCKP